MRHFAVDTWTSRENRINAVAAEDWVHPGDVMDKDALGDPEPASDPIKALMRKFVIAVVPTFPARAITLTRCRTRYVAMAIATGAVAGTPETIGSKLGDAISSVPDLLADIAEWRRLLATVDANARGSSLAKPQEEVPHEARGSA